MALGRLELLRLSVDYPVLYTKPVVVRGPHDLYAMCAGIGPTCREPVIETTPPQRHCCVTRKAKQTRLEKFHHFQSQKDRGWITTKSSCISASTACKLRWKYLGYVSELLVAAIISSGVTIISTDTSFAPTGTSPTASTCSLKASATKEKKWRNENEKLRTV